MDIIFFFLFLIGARLKEQTWGKSLLWAFLGLVIGTLVGMLIGFGFVSMAIKNGLFKPEKDAPQESLADKVKRENGQTNTNAPCKAGEREVTIFTTNPPSKRCVAAVPSPANPNNAPTSSPWQWTDWAKLNL
jgi:hypothetical protein